MTKLPSPCIDICKYRRQGHCIACSMTEAQKRALKGIDAPQARAAFVEAIERQQHDLGGYRHWAHEYTRKCLKKGVRWTPNGGGGAPGEHAAGAPAETPGPGCPAGPPAAR